jgi:transcriptional regulator
MYLPPHFREDDPALLMELMQRHGFATLISNLDGTPFATHLPLKVRQDGTTVRIDGHVARANPHWQALEGDPNALVIFQGPHTYISPTLYRSSTMVPTWNYVAVHAYGTAEVFTDADRLRTLVSALTDRHEAGRVNPWKVADAPADYIDGMLKAIVGFALPIQRLEGKRKLSQNRNAADITGVREGLAASPDVHDQALAHLMR